MTQNTLNSNSNFRKRNADITSLIPGKVPPQSVELEEAVLGACMLEKDTFARILEIIQSPDCFYVDAHQKIYAAMRRLFDKGNPVDLLTIHEELKKSGELELVGGSYFISKLTMSVTSSAHAEAHAQLVMEKFVQRELIRLSGVIINEAYEDSTDVFDLLDKAESNLYEITDKHLRKNFKSLQDVLMQTLAEIEESKKKTEAIIGVPSGLRELDEITSGWQKTDLIILAARPSVGKTAFALNLCLNAAMNAKKEFPVAVFSLEMSAGQIVKRMLSTVTDVNLEKIARGNMEEHEFVQMTMGAQKLKNAKIFLDDQAALNIFELRAKARRLKQKHHIEMIVIDYLQLMQGSGDKNGNREQEISKISRDLKALAKELNIPIIALSQLNRSVENSTRTNKIPQLSDLRESGAIEQDADMVMFLYRPEYHGHKEDENGPLLEGQTEIVIAKHRNGSTGNVTVQFLREKQKFVDINRGTGTYGAGGSPAHYNAMAGLQRNPDGFGPESTVHIQPGATPPGAYKTAPSRANFQSFTPPQDDSDFTSTPPPISGSDDPPPYM